MTSHGFCNCFKGTHVLVKTSIYLKNLHEVYYDIFVNALKQLSVMNNPTLALYPSQNLNVQ